MSPADPESGRPAPDDLLARLDVPVPRYTSYPTVPSWTRAFDHAAHERALRRAAEAGADEPLSLYVHLPFCRHLCAYCGCNVVVSRDPRRPAAYLENLEREMDLVAALLGDRLDLAELHWGGGTPTLLDEEQIASLHRAIVSRFRLRPDTALSIEVDPRSTPPAKLALLRELGFGRVSVGVQDLDEAVQWAVERGQSEEQTTATIEHARALGFSSIGVDLICGLPLQIDRSWRRTVETIAALRPDRIAVFSLAYVPDVRPHQRRLDGLPRPTGARKLELQLLARDVFERAGYRAIGFDHYALPTDDLARARDEGRLARSFQGYTVRRAPDLVGLGVTAISEVGGAYGQNVRPLGSYAAALRAGRLPTERGIVISEDDRRRRRVIETLLCTSRVDLADEERLWPALERLRPLERDGIVRIDGTRVEITRLGAPFARLAAAAFDASFRGPEASAHARAI